MSSAKNNGKNMLFVILSTRVVLPTECIVTMFSRFQVVRLTVPVVVISTTMQHASGATTILALILITKHVEVKMLCTIVLYRLFIYLL